MRMRPFIYKWSTERRGSPKAKTLMPVSFVRPPWWFSLHDVLSRSDDLGYFSVLQAFGNELDDSVFTFTWDTFP